MNTRNLFLAAAYGLSLLAGSWSGLARAADAQAQASGGSDALFRALDTDRNGALSPQEFHAGYLGLQRAIAVEIRLHEQFRAVDANHDGAIDAGEYARLLLVRRLGKAAPTLSTFDVDKNRKLDFGEYMAAIRHLAALQQAPAAVAAKPATQK